jgi:hypothetical protein
LHTNKKNMQPTAKDKRITNKHLEDFQKELNTIIDLYKQQFSEQKPIDWKTYEKQWANRLRVALKELKSVRPSRENDQRRA